MGKVEEQSHKILENVDSAQSPQGLTRHHPFP